MFIYIQNYINGLKNNNTKESTLKNYGYILKDADRLRLLIHGIRTILFRELKREIKEVIYLC